tara:strand:- start:466 stop:906 length:441 start_codon:yes stop_codon:yes gene_type:complete
MSETVTEHDMPQKEACDLMNISGATMKKLRERHLATDDWYYVERKGGRPRIMIRPTGIAKLKVHYAAAEVLPLMVPRFCRAKVIKFATNPKIVMAGIELPTGEWVKGAVFVTEKIKQHLGEGKPFRVQVIEDEDGNRSYRHEKLCP